MTGPEHYKRAEKALDNLRELIDGLSADDSKATAIVAAAGPLMAAAQVHATLALAAATALNTSENGGMFLIDAAEWEKVCSRTSDGEQS